MRLKILASAFLSFASTPLFLAAEKTLAFFLKEKPGSHPVGLKVVEVHTTNGSHNVPQVGMFPYRYMASSSSW